jgi:hypothetical protein
MIFTSRNLIKQLTRAKSFFTRHGYKVREISHTYLWDILAESDTEKIYVQIYTTEERKKDFEKVGLPKGAHGEIFKYSDGQIGDVPTNRIIYPSNY